MHKTFRLLTASAVVTLGPALLAQANGQYNDPNYNNSNPNYNQSNPNYNNQSNNGTYGQSGTYNNGQNGTYNNGQSGTYNNGQYDHDRDRDRDRDRTYANGQNGQYGNTSDYRYHGDVVPAGAEFHVRADQTINVSKDNAQVGQLYPATIADDVRDQNGNVVIPRGARAQLRLVSADPNDNAGNNNGNLTLDLDSVEVSGRRYQIDAQGTSASGSTNRGGIGMNQRTGKYVGGGALAGTLLGALAGGGKGAAIGAIVGGAAGAGTQVMTRGHSLNVPAETVLNFRLQDPVTMHAYSRGNDPYDNRNQLPPR